MSKEEQLSEKDVAAPLVIEVAIDLRLLLRSSEVGESMDGPDSETVAGISKITQAFSDKAAFIALQPSERWHVMRWLLAHDLFSKFRVTPERFLFFKRHVDIQHFFVTTPGCRFVVSGNEARLSRLAGLRIKRLLVRPGFNAETRRDGLMRNVVQVPDYDTLYRVLTGNEAEVVTHSNGKERTASI